MPLRLDEGTLFMQLLEAMYLAVASWLGQAGVGLSVIAITVVVTLLVTSWIDFVDKD